MESMSTRSFKPVEFPFSIVVSVAAPHYGIGFNGDIPWTSEQDHIHFEEVTCNINDDFKMNAVIMGYNTWKALSYRPLDKRVNIVVTSKENNCFSNLGGTVVYVKTLYLALMICKMRDDIEKAFVIGGYSLFTAAIRHPWLKAIYVTEIESETPIPVDMTFPLKEKLHDLTNFDIYVLGCSREAGKRVIYKRFDKKFATTDWSDDHPFAWT
jgi:dihydrofolate reductase